MKILSPTEFAVTTSKIQTDAERKKVYRQRKGNALRATDANRKRLTRAAQIPQFIAVDSEGIGNGANHRAVLLGVGDKHYIARNLEKGLQWDEVFRFLYKQYEATPQAAFVGFFLSYDFNQWLRSLPFKAAQMLLTPDGKAIRKNKNHNSRMKEHPVRVGGWEINVLGFKRLSIRPIPDDCKCGQRGIKCPAKKHSEWMHICDAGPFYQMSLLAVLDKDKWKDDPEGWPITQEEYDIVKEGKDKRAIAELDDDMIRYNDLENEILARVMDRLAKGFAAIGIKLAKDQWYGPGASASKWLKMKGATRKAALIGAIPDVERLMPEWFWQASKNSYIGGWFELFSHGLIYGTSYNYDINNAYPYAQTKLPHICSDCTYVQGEGEYTGNGDYVLYYGEIVSSGTRIGAMPYRDSKGAILRPAHVKGWYWRHEIEAAKRAGLVKRVSCKEWVEFIPCNDDKPFAEVYDLYQRRLNVGKNSAQGMAIKLNNNSLYGKFAQSVGESPYNNWFYASFITSHCRAQILDAIATHPNGPDSVLMIATDGICFDSPHAQFEAVIDAYRVSTGKNKDDRLGYWEGSTYVDLCLFKPGVYWHRKGKDALVEVKSRGVPKTEFAAAISDVEYQFALMHDEGHFPGMLVDKWAIDQGADPAFLHSEKGWPRFWVPIKFRMRSCKQALNEHNWDGAGEVQEEKWIVQDSDPQSKRRKPFYNRAKRRIDTIIHDLPYAEIQTYYHKEIKIPVPPDMGYDFDGDAINQVKEIAMVAKGSSLEYPSDIEWDNVWGGE